MSIYIHPIGVIYHTFFGILMAAVLAILGDSGTEGYNTDATFFLMEDTSEGPIKILLKSLKIV
jgi:hypothetical protein